MKKLIIITIITVALTSSIFASGFNIGVGGIFGYDAGTKDLYTTETKGNITNFSNLHAMTFGVDNRLKLWFVEIVTDINYRKGPGIKGGYGYDHNLMVDVSVGPTFDLFNFMRITLGAGMEANLRFANNFNLAEKQSDGSYKTSSFSTAILLNSLKDSVIFYRAGLGFFYSNLYIGFEYTVPTTFSINNPTVSYLAPNFKNGRYGCVISLDLF